MNKAIFISLVSLFCLSIFGCEKCYTCTQELPVYVNGQEAGTIPATYEFCDSPADATLKAEVYEDEGARCAKQ